jgi:GxxExxY protein
LNHEEHEGHEERPSWKLCQEIIGCAMRVHAELGPGLLEPTYSVCMAHEFALKGVPFERERRVPVTYKGAFLESGFRIDLLVADEVVVEIKAVEALLPVHEAQVLTYLKLSRLRVGLLLNFNVRLMKDGIRRLVL